MENNSDYREGAASNADNGKAPPLGESTAAAPIPGLWPRIKLCT